ncbi:MAG: hypothetical protein ABI658_24115 [Acidimicrobiales bacterium]
MTPTTRATATIATVGIIAGAIGTARAQGGFTNRHGSDVGYAALDMHLMSFNRLGGLIAMALGALALLGTLRAAQALVALAAIGYGAFAIQTLIGFRQTDGGNITGANGATLSFCLLMAIGLGTLTWTEHTARNPTTRTRADQAN